VSETETSIVPSEREIVAPASPERVLAAMKAFEWFKSNALTPNDYQPIAGKNYIKKSGWMKIALACNVSLEKREERVEDLESGVRVYHYTYRAIAPSGRFADAVGSASTDEREFTHEVHDVRALAQTRACNRAISNLVGGGEVSAEEMVGAEKKTEAKPVEPSKPSELVLVRFLQDVPPIVGVDLKTYGPFKKEDVANLPRENAEALVKQGLAKRVGAPELEQPPKVETIEVKSKTGILLGIAEATVDSFIVEPCVEVRVDQRPFQGFLIPRILAPIKEKYGAAYRVDVDNAGFLTQISLTGLKLDETRVKELVKAVAWTLERASEKAGGT